MLAHFVDIHEGPFPTAYRRGLNQREVSQQMWLQDENYISRELYTNQYFAIEAVGTCGIGYLSYYREKHSSRSPASQAMLYLCVS